MKQLTLATLAAIGVFSLAACEQQQPANSSLSKALEAQRAFERADGNKDGVVSNGEAAAVANLDFGTADKDKNGALTPEEFEVALGASTPRG
jgi:EF hand domain-containing protein